MAPVAYGQFVHPPFLGWYPQALYLSVVDFPGLFAFGGSLLGAATIFRPARCRPERIVVLARSRCAGAASPRGGDRGALVGLPLGAVLG